MDLPAKLMDPRLIVMAQPGAAGSLVIVWQDVGGIRQVLAIRQTERLSDDALELDVPFPMPSADPSLFISLAATALGVLETSTAAIVIGTVVSVAVNAAIGLGLSLIERALFDRGQQLGQIPPQVTPVRQIVRQSTPRQRFIYGRALVGGAYSYLNKNPPYLITQFLVAAHACDAVEAVYINGYLCEFNSAGDAVTPRFRRDGTPYLKISTRLGDPDQAIDPLLASEFPDIPTTFRQRRHTVVTLRAYYGNDYDDHENVWGPAATFSPLFLVRGKKVHDPRVYSSDPDDETTWAWSRNWALCTADWMRSSYGGRKKVAQIDYDAIAAEADLCDQPIALTTGATEPRYTLDGGFQSDQTPFEVVENMLRAAGESACLWRRGKFAPQVDVPRDPVRTLTQSDLVGGFQFRSARTRSEALNTVQSEFVFPLRDYKAAMTPPLVDTVQKTADGQELAQTVSRPFVAGEERSQRLDKITLERSRLGRELRIIVGIEHLELEAGDHVLIEFDDFAAVNGAYVIRQASSDGLLRTMELTLQEAAPTTLYAWDPSTDVQDTSKVTILDPEAT